MLMDKRKNKDYFSLIRFLLANASFFGVLGLHDDTELREMTNNQMFKEAQERIEFRTLRINRERDAAREKHRGRMLELE